VTSYVTHEYWRLGSDTILDNLSWDAKQSTPPPQLALNEHYAQQQAHRITRAASPLWLHQAQQALQAQQARHEASGDLQMMERG
jgi:hypothetical protein